uniref:PIPK domain-containing protein n=1 Tax=Macrostomum lignano TaxID=282301 RepID=A0A1I8F830_9PLAT
PSAGPRIRWASPRRLATVRHRGTGGFMDVDWQSLANKSRSLPALAVDDSNDEYDEASSGAERANLSDLSDAIDNPATGVIESRATPIISWPPIRANNSSSGGHRQPSRQRRGIRSHRLNQQQPPPHTDRHHDDNDGLSAAAGVNSANSGVAAVVLKNTPRTPPPPSSLASPLAAFSVTPGMSTEDKLARHRAWLNRFSRSNGHPHM